MNWPAPGIYHGISPAVYFADHAGPMVERPISKSMLWDFAKNPRRWLEGPPKKITDAMKWGSLVDCLALTPERFPTAYKIVPDTYVSAPADVVLTSEYPGTWNGRTAVCREWKAGQESAGKVVMTPEEHAKASEPKPWNWNSKTCQEWLEDLPAGVDAVLSSDHRSAVQAVEKLCARREFAEMMEDGQTQVGMRIEFDQSIHGFDDLVIPGKGLLDLVPCRDGGWGNALVDLKMIFKLDDLEQVEQEFYYRGYHVQAALYLDMWNALTGENRDAFYFIMQLSEPPYEVAVIELSADAIIAGRKWYLAAIKAWAKAASTGKWDSPWDGIQHATLPAWAARKEAS